MSIKILALDTSTENCSVALLVGDKLYSRSEIAPRDHTKKVLPMVDEVLKEAGISLKQLDALAFGRGPGSFTGVRIGIGIAQGLAFGANLPMIAISTLAAMAQGSYRIYGCEHVACAIDARMEELYWGRFIRQPNGCWVEYDVECVIEPNLLCQQILDETIKDNSQQVDSISIDSKHTIWYQAGTGWEAYAQILQAMPLDRIQGEVLYPDAQDIATLAAFEWAKGNTVSVEHSQPVYLRDKVAWKKLPGRE